MTEFPYQLTTLPNGARVASVDLPHMRSVAVGFWVAIGGRHETSKTSGISHFIEHLLFKGTPQRNSKQITEQIEGVGGYINAFTTEDHTCYYAKAAAPHFERLCAVLGDIFRNSIFAAAEIEKEREVVREEILMYRDTPAQHAQELLTETMWPEHALGRPLTGTVKTIAAFKRKQLLDFQRQHYSGRNTIVSVAGPLRHERVTEILAPILRKLPTGRTPRFARACLQDGPARVSVVTQETEQTHLAMGFHAFGRTDDRRFALKLLSVILGENMSSRLFQKLREDRGYCYSVQTSTVTLEDAGCFSLYAGLDPRNLKATVKLIMRELEKICQRKPGKEELRKAQDYTIGQTLMGLESTTNQMMWMGESLLGYDHIIDPCEVERRLHAVTAEEIQSCACACLSRGRLGVAVVGPVKEAKQIESWLR